MYDDAKTSFADKTTVRRKKHARRKTRATSGGSFFPIVGQDVNSVYPTVMGQHRQRVR